MYNDPSSQLTWELHEAAIPDEDPAQRLPSVDNEDLDNVTAMQAVDEEYYDDDYTDAVEYVDPDKDFEQEEVRSDANSAGGLSSPIIMHTAMEDASPESTVSDFWDVVHPSRKDDPLHKKAHMLIPHVLPPERYWIAVLLHSANPKETRKEKDFVWLKGNRKNTVETIWQFYRDVTTEEKVKLTIHEESPSFEVTIEELDFYNDHLVVFRAGLNSPVIFLD